MTNRTFTYHAATKELQYEDIRLNAISMYLPDEDDGKEFVEFVHFVYGYHNGIEFIAIAEEMISGSPKECKCAIPIQKQESEDELWDVVLASVLTLPETEDVSEQAMIDMLKKIFTIKRK